MIISVGFWFFADIGVGAYLAVLGRAEQQDLFLSTSASQLIEFNLFWLGLLFAVIGGSLSLLLVVFTCNLRIRIHKVLTPRNYGSSAVLLFRGRPGLVDQRGGYQVE